LSLPFKCFSDLGSNDSYLRLNHQPPPPQNCYEHHNQPQSKPLPGKGQEVVGLGVAQQEKKTAGESCGHFDTSTSSVHCRLVSWFKSPCHPLEKGWRKKTDSSVALRPQNDRGLDSRFRGNEFVPYFDRLSERG